MHWQSPWHTVSVFIDSAAQPCVLVSLTGGAPIGDHRLISGILVRMNRSHIDFRSFLFNNRAICAHLFDRSSFGFRNSDFGFRICGFAASDCGPKTADATATDATRKGYRGFLDFPGTDSALFLASCKQDASVRSTIQPKRSSSDIGTVTATGVTQAIRSRA